MNTQSAQPASSALLGELIDRLFKQSENGEPIDLNQLVQEYPEYSEQLRRVVPMLCELSAMDWRGENRPISFEDQLRTAEQRTLGDFRILHQIGRGGMGIVFEAQQLTINRKVALKILPLAALVDSRALQRFKNEVTAIATLQHPHIVAVYSIGEERGIHYFAMQLIRGQSLAAVIRELRTRSDQDQRLSGDALNQAVSDIEKQETAQAACGSKDSRSQEVGDLDETKAETVARGRSSTVRNVGDPTYFRNVAQLVRQAAEALQHAHEHGIVHRDVKPGNLLLDSSGTLFVTDFGLARIETGAGVTMTGDILGTLRYMSPEQVQGNKQIVDHRTDIYSLGATLYELLTLQPLWSGNDKPELIRQISFEEPTRPQRINPAIPTDLETIVLKAISKNPGDRYDSAQVFADDIQSFLDHKSILAKRPRVNQRVLKWSRRNPSIVTSVAFVLLLATIALVVSNFLILRQKGIAEQSTLEAQQQSRRAERNLDKALNAVEQILTRVADERLMNTPRMEQLRKLIYDDALKISQSIIAEESAHPAAQRRVAAAYFSVARINQELGNLDAAEIAYDQSITHWKQWLAKFPNHDLSRDCNLRLAKSFANQSAVFSERGNVKKAFELRSHGIQILQVLSDETTIESDPTLHLQIAIAIVELANLERRIGNADTALAMFENGINIIGQLTLSDEDDADLRIWLAWAHGHIATALLDLNDLPQSAGHMEAALAILDKWVPGATDQVWARTQLIETLRDLGRFYTQFQPKKAMPLLLRAVSEAEELCSQFPDMPGHHQSLGKTISYLATVHEHLGDFNEAKAAYERANQTYMSTVGLFPELPEPRYKRASNLRALATLFKKTGRPQQFVETITEAIDLHEQLAKEFPAFPHYREGQALAYESLATHHFFNDDLDIAEKTAREAMSVLEGLVSEFPENVYYEKLLADMHDCLGSIFLHGERYGEANDQYLRCLAIATDLRGRFPYEESYEELLLRIHGNVATSYCTLGQTENAEKTFLATIEILKQKIAKYPFDATNRINSAAIHENLGRLYKEDQQYQKAIQPYRTAVEFYKELVVNNPDNEGMRSRLAESYRAVASVLALSGEHLPALDALESAFECGYQPSVEEFQNDSDFDNIRDQPRYQTLLSRLSDASISTRWTERSRYVARLDTDDRNTEN